MSFGKYTVVTKNRSRKHVSFSEIAISENKTTVAYKLRGMRAIKYNSIKVLMKQGHRSKVYNKLIVAERRSTFCKPNLRFFILVFYFANRVNNIFRMQPLTLFYIDYVKTLSRFHK